MVALLCRRPSLRPAVVEIWAGVTSVDQLTAAKPGNGYAITLAEIASLSDTCVIPWFDDMQAVTAFDKMREHERVASGRGWITGKHDARWDFRSSGPDGALSQASDTPGAWAILMTRHVGPYRINTKEPFRSWTMPDRLLPLNRGVERTSDGVILSASHPLIIFRHPSRNDDARTLICTALSAKGLLHNKGYVHAIRHERETSTENLLALLAYMNSLTCDWWVRRFVDRHVTAPIINNLPLPYWDDAQRHEAASAAAALLRRQNDLSSLAGGRVLLEGDADAYEDFDLLASIEALVASGFSIERDEFLTMLEDFSDKGCPVALRDRIGALL